MTKKFDSMKTMLEHWKYRKQVLYQCENCGKLYPSAKRMEATKCHNHPKGAWQGVCSCPHGCEMFGEICEATAENKKDMEKKAPPKVAPVPLRPKETPNPLQVLFPGIIKVSDIPLQTLARELVQHWASEKAKNTLRYLTASCSLECGSIKINGKSESGLNRKWLPVLERLQTTLNNEEFWKSVYWFLESNLMNNGVPGDALKHYPMGNLNGKVIVPALSYFYKETTDKTVVTDLVCSVLALSTRAEIGSRSIHSSWAAFLENMYKNTLQSKDFYENLYCLIRLDLMPFGKED